MEGFCICEKLNVIRICLEVIIKERHFILEGRKTVNDARQVLPFSMSPQVRDKKRFPMRNDMNSIVKVAKKN